METTEPEHPLLPKASTFLVWQAPFKPKLRHATDTSNFKMSARTRLHAERCMREVERAEREKAGA